MHAVLHIWFLNACAGSLSANTTCWVSQSGIWIFLTWTARTNLAFSRFWLIFWLGSLRSNLVIEIMRAFIIDIRNMTVFLTFDFLDVFWRGVAHHELSGVGCVVDVRIVHLTFIHIFGDYITLVVLDALFFVHFYLVLGDARLEKLLHALLLSFVLVAADLLRQNELHIALNNLIVVINISF